MASSATLTGRVLVVEDDKVVRWTVTDRLASRGFDVKAVDRGEQALEFVAKEPLDVMLVDLRLPGIDGVQTLVAALNVRPSLVVLMMSAHGTVETAVAAMKRGAIDFLVKPIAPNVLDEALDRAMAAAAARRTQSGSLASEEALRRLVGPSEAMQSIRAVAAQLASTTSTTPILLRGEPGTGKDLLAQVLHAASARASRPFVTVNCAAASAQACDAALFGDERAPEASKEGLFADAAGGTLLISEIDQIPQPLQAKLFGLLKAKRLGAPAEQLGDVRVLASSACNLEELIQAGRFRADLFYQLNVVRIDLPPLRERREDVGPLAAVFVARHNAELHRHVEGVSPQALELLARYRWPGNVRELANVIERAFILFPQMARVLPEHLPPEVRNAPPDAANRLVSLEHKAIVDALAQSGGNQSEAARRLGITRDTLRYRLKKYGIAS